MKQRKRGIRVEELKCLWWWHFTRSTSWWKGRVPLGHRSVCVCLRSPVDEVYMVHNLKFSPVTEMKESVFLRVKKKFKFSSVQLCVKKTKKIIKRLNDFCFKCMLFFWRTLKQCRPVSTNILSSKCFQHWLLIRNVSWTPN